MTTPLPGDGRNQVVDLSVIDVDWGNAVSDRTIQSYTNQSDRDSLWPTPRNGSQSYTADTDEFWVRQSGKWVRTPGGFIGSNYGPSTRMSCPGTGPTVIQTYSFPVKINRHYLVNTYSNGALSTSIGSTIGTLATDDQGTALWVGIGSDFPQGRNLIGSLSFIYTPTMTKTAVITLIGHTWVANAQYTFDPNTTMIQVTDIGG